MHQTALAHGEAPLVMPDVSRTNSMGSLGSVRNQGLNSAFVADRAPVTSMSRFSSILRIDRQEAKAARETAGLIDRYMLRF
jgi:hypothetical protein